ncbi:MAG TPA: 4'-phosphopantetheinyl transferase superfamily protein [Gemmatimonadales bacterium]|jgi:4'-phosphopantetheinyl transferase
MVDASLDLWLVRVDQIEGDGRVDGCLDQAETARASRFRFRHDASRFAACRGALRHILSHYTEERPHTVRLAYGAAGKPFLPDHRSLRFNLTHAGNLLLIGVSRSGEVGVDVERLQPDSVVEETSTLVLSRPEREMMAGLSGRARGEWFARLWTRKEAYIKADGRGMGLKLDLIDVMTAPDRVRLRREDSARWLASPRWSLRSLTVEAGYAAAAAVEGHDWRLDVIEWPGAVRLAG